LASGTGAAGARLTARVEPAAGWVRVGVSVTGIAAGTKCRVVLMTRAGERRVAASWVVSAQGEQAGTNLDGAVIVAPDDVVGVVVESLDDMELVAADI